MTLDCICRLQVGFWTVMRIPVTPEILDLGIERAKAQKKYHQRAKGRTVDRAFAEDMEENEICAQIAEVAWSVGSGQELHEIQTSGPLIRTPDTKGDVGVRYTHYQNGMLLFRSPVRYRRNQWDPLDEPEVLARGDRTLITFHGWATMRMASPTYDRSGPWWSESLRTWAMPESALHRLPTDRGSGRPIWMLHRTPTPTERAARSTADDFTALQRP